ncbi:MAG: MarR family transcriptional regulator [Chryseolinea sp.]
MSIDKDIIPLDVTTAHQRALVNIFSTYYYLVDKMSGTFKKYDITRQQYQVLTILRSQQPKAASVNLIKARMLDKMSDVSRIVERLRIKDLIVRQSATNDKRSVDVIITTKGIELLDKVQPDIESFGHHINKLSEEETIALNYMLDKIRTTGKAHLLDEFSRKSAQTALSRNL